MTARVKLDPSTTFSAKPINVKLTPGDHALLASYKARIEAEFGEPVGFSTAVRRLLKIGLKAEGILPTDAAEHGTPEPTS